MCDANDQDDEFFILNPANGAIITYAIAPEPGKTRLERFAKTARIGRRGDTFVEVIKDLPLNAFVRLFYIL